MTKLEEDIRVLQDLIDHSSHIVFFGGAGVSTESGIPDFRSQDGLYKQKYKYPPEMIISHSFFMNETEEFYRFYRDKMLLLDKKPNPCHLYLAELEKTGKLDCVITQNIDGLHTIAGNKKVVELHGSIHRNYCMDCGSEFSAPYIKDSETIVPHCPFCGGIIKPDVVLYEEALDESNIEKAITAIENADLLLVAGTSLVVYPACTFLNYYHGNHMVLINKDNCANDNRANLVIHQKVGELFKGLKI